MRLLKQITSCVVRSVPATSLIRTRLELLAGLAVLLLAGTCASAAQATVTHEYLPLMSERATNGVSAGPGVTPPGHSAEVEAMGGDSGHMWLGERLSGGTTRVDAFDVAGETYLGQLSEEGGLGSLTDGVAVGHHAGEELVYVGAGEAGKQVVGVYGSNRRLQAVWTGAHTANGAFAEDTGTKAQAGVIDGVAADNSASVETQGDVYVATRGLAGAPQFNTVDVLRPGAGGEEGESVGSITGLEEPLGVAVSGFNGDVLVADGNQNKCEVGAAECVVAVFAPEGGMPGVYNLVFKITGSPSDGPFKALGPLAVDASNGHIYVLERHANVIDEYAADGEYLGHLTGTTAPDGSLRPFHAPLSVGVDSVSGDVFVGDHESEKSEGSVDAFGPDVVVPDVHVREPPAALAPHAVVLRGGVNPRGEGEAKCEFEYGTTASYGQRVACSGPVANGESEVEVHSVEASGLAPDTTYHYRLDANNAHGADLGECPRDCGQFTTPGPGVSEEGATEVSASAARIGVTIDPNGKPTSFYVQYGTSSTAGCEASPSSCTDVPAPPGVALGEGGQLLRVSQQIQGLAADTVYHYRVIAVSELAHGASEAFPQPDRTFRTQPAGTTPGLPDGRRWELVSPPDKHGALVLPIEEVGVLQSAASGEAISYGATLPTETGAQGYFETVQVLSRRAANGWSSEDISLPHSSAVGSSVGAGSEYRLLSTDLASAIVEPFGEFTSLAPCVSPLDSERTPYLRHDDSPCAGRLGTYAPLLTSEDVAPGTKFGGNPASFKGEARVLGATGDLSHVLLSSALPLTLPPHVGEHAERTLYEWSAGISGPQALELVSVLPNGTLAPGEAEPGTVRSEAFEARGPISSDGTRVVWSERGQGHLYQRDLAAGRTVMLDAAQASCLATAECGGGAVMPVFQIASRDGSRVFFTDTQRLTANAGEVPGKADLYVCEITEGACTVSDLTAQGAPPLTAADVQGAVLGASEDGNTVYFVANGVLAQEASRGACMQNTPPEGATCNLYVEHRGVAGWEAPKLVAVLGGEDWPDWKGEPGTGLEGMTARVSGNGRFIAFMSDRSLTGYDNRDAATGAPDEEVFLYDAEGNGGAGRLICASCSPTEARPHGVEYAKLKEGITGSRKSDFSATQGIAASVPGWTPFNLKEARYQSRYLTNEGRLFFDSGDELVPHDENGNQDVYEFEPTGVGSCSAAAAGFSDATGGCVQLISSGRSAAESGFLDASESGDDVFFLTTDRLVGADTDTAFDVYDAHVCSAGAPCLSEPPPPPVCASAEACRPSASGQGIFGAPPSALFSGAGNLPPVSPPRGGSRGQTRAQKLRAALKACHKLKSRHRRARCEAHARTLYGRHHKSSRSARGKKRGQRG